MTVNEMIKALEELANNGLGNAEVVTAEGEGIASVVENVWNKKEKEITIYTY